MTDFSDEPRPTSDRLLGYVADLELEVDRLRRQGRFIEKQTAESLARIIRLCSKSAGREPVTILTEVDAIAHQLFEVVKDMHDSPGYHPVHDQVVAIAVRPLIEQVYRWQQRLTGTRGIELQLELKVDHVEWFPVRFRHIIDNLFSHALRHRDPGATAQWVRVGLQAVDGNYELRVSDNGSGPPPGEDRRILELFYRATPAWNGGYGVGLVVVKLLVEQSGGTMVTSPRENGGNDFVLTLPRYDLLDYLE
jgi:signal transduction histidine kinase